MRLYSFRCYNPRRHHAEKTAEGTSAVADWEYFVGLISGVTAMITWAPWYRDIFRVNRLAAPPRYRLILGLAPVACLLLLLASLQQFSARAVRESGAYILLYLMLGAAFLGVSVQCFALLGVSACEDVLERRNGASLIAVAGALAGAILCVAGGNIGEGPGASVVVACAATAMGTWFLLWWLLEVGSGGQVSEQITVERDRGGAIRLAALLVANGAIVGAAVAGDWNGARFLRDFSAFGWPALALTVIAAAAERVRRTRWSGGQSLLAAAVYLLASLLWVFTRRLA